MRNPAAKHLYPIYSYLHLDGRPGEFDRVGELISDLFDKMLDELPDGPEKAAGFRKLLEAKDCFVRAGVK